MQASSKNIERVLIIAKGGSNSLLARTHQEKGYTVMATDNKTEATAMLLYSDEPDVWEKTEGDISIHIEEGFEKEVPDSVDIIYVWASPLTSKETRMVSLFERNQSGFSRGS